MIVGSGAALLLMESLSVHRGVTDPVAVTTITLSCPHTPARVWLLFTCGALVVGSI